VDDHGGHAVALNPVDDHGGHAVAHDLIDLYASVTSGGNESKV
jgi:hypothetical protein